MILSILTGFFAPFLKPLIGLFQSRIDNKHESRMMELQMEANDRQHEHRVQELNISADIRETEALLRHDVNASAKAAPWMHTLRASVRPVITYSFFLVFVTVELTALYTLVAAGDSVVAALSLLWGENEQAIFGAIIGFWFGGRALERMSHVS